MLKKLLRNLLFDEMYLIDCFGIEKLLHDSPDYFDGGIDPNIVAAVEPHAIGIGEELECFFEGPDKREEAVVGGVDDGYPTLDLARDEAMAHDVLKEIDLSL